MAPEAVPMADFAAVESILHELERNEGVQYPILVSLAGSFLAGAAPKGVYVDTFASMFAVVIGSADTIAAELKENLQSVVIQTSGAKCLVVRTGRKTVLAVRLPTNADPQRVEQAIAKYIPRIEEYL